MAEKDADRLWLACARPEPYPLGVLYHAGLARDAGRVAKSAVVEGDEGGAKGRCAQHVRPLGRRRVRARLTQAVAVENEGLWQHRRALRRRSGHPNAQPAQRLLLLLPLLLLLLLLCITINPIGGSTCTASMEHESA